MKDKGPLKGIKIVDLTAMVSGPTATMMLGDQGADVIKVEPLEGELMRKVGDELNGMTNSFLCCNRSKRSITLNLKSKKGLQILKKLINTADVFIQNFRPGTVERMGLSYNKIKKINQNLVYVSISGFGEKGPYSQQRVYDPVIQALSGLADIQRDQITGVPKQVRTIIPDKTTGLATAQAISSALFYRERYGKGQHIKLAMLDVMIAYLWPEGSAALSFVGKEKNPSIGQLGLDLVFKTKDEKYITAGAVTNKEWKGMCVAFDRMDLIDNKKFASRYNITTDLLNHIKKQHDVNVIGFYIIKRVRKWDLERHVGDYKDYYDKEKKVMNMRKELTKHKAVACNNEGYDKYFILDGKKMAVENFDMSGAEVKKGTASELKRIFGKSMANRLVSRVVLNKFIQEVA